MDAICARTTPTPIPVDAARELLVDEVSLISRQLNLFSGLRTKIALPRVNTPFTFASAKGVTIAVYTLPDLSSRARVSSVLG